MCCFVCTREPKRTTSKRTRRGVSEPNRPPNRYSAKSNPSMRRSMRISTRTADSGFDTYYEPSLTHAYSDTELRLRLSNIFHKVQSNRIFL